MKGDIIIIRISAKLAIKKIYISKKEFICQRMLGILIFVLAIIAAFLFGEPPIL